MANLDSERRPAGPREDAAPLEARVGLFAPISLDEMDSVRLMDRVDTKYIYPRALLPDLIGQLIDDYRVLEVDGERLAPYSTLYFDTPSRKAYYDHHNGKSNRHKYRMREYRSTGQAFFEVKQRNNKGRTVKRREAIAAIRPRLDSRATAMIGDTAGWRGEMGPAIWTRFKRITFVGRDRPERVTVDLDLEFLDLENHRAGLPSVAIVEVKQARSDGASPMRELLRHEGHRPTRISKYCVASLLLDPTLKRNRFKTALLAVQALEK